MIVSEELSCYYESIIQVKKCIMYTTHLASFSLSTFVTPYTMATAIVNVIVSVATHRSNDFDGAE